MLIRRDSATHLLTHGVDLRVFELGTNTVNMVVVSVREGHFQEFYHKVSRFTYYMMGGEGTFYLNGEATPVHRGDVITIEPMTRIYYKGQMEMILVTTPAWTPDGEVEVRKIPRSELVPAARPQNRMGENFDCEDDEEDYRPA